MPSWLPQYPGISSCARKYGTSLSAGSPQLSGLTRDSAVKIRPANAGDFSSILGQEDPLEEEITTHSSILAWKIPWTEEPGGLQSMESQRVRHN